MGPGGGAAGAAAGTTGPFARTRLSTWAPRRRTHLLCAACAGLLAYFSIVSMYPLRPEWTMFEVAGAVYVYFTYSMHHCTNIKHKQYPYQYHWCHKLKIFHIIVLSLGALSEITALPLLFSVSLRSSVPTPPFTSFF